jgi:hypothetical protein
MISSKSSTKRTYKAKPIFGSFKVETRSGKFVWKLWLYFKKWKSNVNRNIMSSATSKMSSPCGCLLTISTWIWMKNSSGNFHFNYRLVLLKSFITSHLFWFVSRKTLAIWLSWMSSTILLTINLSKWRQFSKKEIIIFLMPQSWMKWCISWVSMASQGLLCMMIPIYRKAEKAEWRIFIQSKSRFFGIKMINQHMTLICRMLRWKKNHCPGKSGLKAIKIPKQWSMLKIICLLNMISMRISHILSSLVVKFVEIKQFATRWKQMLSLW